MYNDVDTYAVRDREWKNKMIAFNNMPLMTIKEL
jgi:hypothetical protein